MHSCWLFWSSCLPRLHLYQCTFMFYITVIKCARQQYTTLCRLSHNVKASEQLHSTCKSVFSEATSSDAPDSCQLCVCELGEGRQQKSANREQASMVCVMDSLPYVSLHTFIHALLMVSCRYTALSDGQSLPICQCAATVLVYILDHGQVTHFAFNQYGCTGGGHDCNEREYDCRTAYTQLHDPGLNMSKHEKSNQWRAQHSGRQVVQ